MESQITTGIQKYIQLTSWKRLILVTTMLFSAGILPVITSGPVAYASSASHASPASPSSSQYRNGGKTQQQQNLLNQTASGNGVNQSNQAGQAREILQTNQGSILICEGHGKNNNQNGRKGHGSANSTNENASSTKGTNLPIGQKAQNGNITFLCL
ncbi:MAG TPA: hypothetical protein VGL94_11745 [Ktedonobacteraceae bacterium]|jgi:hypothetical protein